MPISARVMPLTSSAVTVFGVITLVLVVILCVAGVLCVAYVLRFRSTIREEKLLALRDFNSLWVVRIILIILAILWRLVELLRLTLLRERGWLFHYFGFQWQANICRSYVLLSMGFLGPCYFLTALFLVHGSLRDAPFTPRRSWNGKVIGLILLFCLPVFLVNFFLVVVTPAFEFPGGYELTSEGYGKLPRYFTAAFEMVETQAHERVALCTFPLFSTLTLGIFGVIYNMYFLYLGWRLFSLVINKRLQIRVYSLVVGVVFLLPVHVIFLGFSVLSKPSEPFFEAMGFMGFLTVILCTCVGEGILVIRPISDALAVRWLFQSKDGTKKNSEEIPTGPILVSLSSLSVFGTEGDGAPIGARQSLLGRSTASNQDSDSHLPEISLVPMENSKTYPETESMLISPPDSPPLPGQPFSFHSLPSLV